MKTAMKAHDALSLDALRFLLSIIRNAEIDLHRDATDEEVVSIIQKEVKKRKEGIEQFEKAGRAEVVAEEKKKLEVISTFLPAQMSPEDVQKEVSAIIAALPTKDMPSAMKEVMAKLKGKAESKLLSDAVKTELAKLA